MLEEIKTAFDQLNRTVEEFKKTNDARLEKIEKGRSIADHEEKLEKMNKAIDERLQRIETAQNRSVASAADAENENGKAAKAAFLKFMRKGDKNLSEAEVKALSVGSDPDGGYLVSPEVSKNIEEKVFETSPMRKVATIETISTSQWEEMAETGEADASWVGEQTTRSNTGTPTLGKLIIPVHELQAQPAATQSILDDASYDIEAWLSRKVSEKFSRKEATAFFAGTGVGQPKGITQYSSGSIYGTLEQVVSGSSSTLTADGLISLQDALFEEFQPGASWFMARATRSVARKLKDSQNNYLWSIDRGLNDGVQESLLGKPVYLAADMPAIGSNALSVAYGDFKRGYVIVDRIGIRVLRDPFTSKPNVLFYTTKRVGGAVRNFQAIKLQKIST